MTNPTGSPPAEETQVVHSLMQVLVKGLRAVQLYLPNNPIYQKAAENLRDAFAAVWEIEDEVVLKVSESTLSWDGEPVLTQEERSESLAWLLYKDGVREVSFAKGVEEGEIVEFLTVLQQVRTLPADAVDDLLTLLWERDFQKIRYAYVELGEEAAPLERTEEEPTASEDVQQAVEEETTEPEPPRGLVSVEDFDTTLYFLDEKEIASLKEEIGREYSQDLRGNVLAMLFDLFELQTFGTVRAEIISIIENLIPYLLAVADFRSVATVLEELRVLLERVRELLPEHRAALHELPARLSQPEPLGQLLQALDEAPVHPSEEELGALFRELRPAALAPVVEWLPKLATERVRTLLLTAAERLARAHPTELIKAMATDDVDVLLQSIPIAGRLKLPPVAPTLGRLLQHPQPPVRRASAEALAAIGTSSAVRLLEQAIDDDDRDVRVAAVRTLGEHGHGSALGKVREAVVGRHLRDADLTEKTAFFEAFGALAGEKGIEVLRGMVGTKGFMKRKVDPQTRACAAMALGKIRTPAARDVLESVKADKDPLVRNAVNKALRDFG